MDLKQVLDAWLREEAVPPIVAHLGIKLVSAADGRAIADLPVRPALFNAMGSLHGGVLADLGDVAIGAAIASASAPGEMFTTTALTVHYFSPVREGLIRASATIVRRGRTVGFAECEVWDASGQLVAKVSASCFFYPPGSASQAAGS